MISSPDAARTKPLARVLDAALLALVAALAAMLLWLVGRPLSTPDLWFHLKTGETYLREGLWPAQDPMLFTGLPTGPVQHEWLFEVAAYSIKQASGLQGLRATHVLLVLLTLMLMTRVLRRAGGSWTAAALGCAAWLALASQRLIQLRPDLVTISGTLLLYGVLIAPRTPRWRTLAFAAPLFCVWANAHSLVAIGVVLLAAAALGAALELGIVSRTLGAPVGQRAQLRLRLLYLLSAFGVSVLASFLHPRGYHQLLTFAESSSDTAVTEIVDEWTAFNPFAPGAARPLAWAVADAVLLVFACGAWLRLRALQREPSIEQVSRFDPPGFIAAAAACGAMLISVRYLWLGWLPLAYGLGALRLDWERVPLRAATLLLTAAICLGYPSNSGFGPELADTPAQLDRYLSNPINRRVVADESVEFLREISAEGRIFTPYLLGSYVGYSLAPRLRTFIDSRTEHYSRQVFEAWRAITAGVALPDGRPYQRALDDFGVDFFFATGMPGYPYNTPYTLHLLEHTPGWVLVFRNAGQALYLRDAARNRGNAQRVAAYYAKLRIPYNPERGLDIGAALNARLDWAVAQRLVPRRLPELERNTLEGSPAARAEASIELADALFAAGAFRSAAHYATQAISAAPDRARALNIALQALRRAGELPAAEALLARVRAEHSSEAWLHSASD